jgi:glutathione S-transferase
MITLYHCVGARSFRPLWMLEELGLPYELKMLPFPPRVLERSYLDVNPLGTVPFFLDGETWMSESAAMCQYLAAKYGPTPLNVPPEEAAFGAFLNFLHFGEATLTFPQAIALRYSRFETEARRQPQVAEDYKRWFLARLRGVDAVVAQAGYVCAGRFTAADVSVGYALLLADYQGWAQSFPSAVQAYWQRLIERPAFQRALDAERAAAVAQGVPTTPAALAQDLIAPMVPSGAPRPVRPVPR